LRISFDLDDTLVCPAGVPAEPPPPWWRRWRYPEAVRLGAPALLRELAGGGWEVWVYTTSARPPRYVNGWFRTLGVRLSGVVNQDVHERVVGRQGPSKYPRAFGIDLHVDDSEGVALEGARHGFAVLTVRPDDPGWADRVRQAARRQLAEGR